MRRKTICILLIILLLICFWNSSVNALSVKITEENLKETMDKLVEENGGDVEVSIENNKIIINEEKIGEGTTVIKYDLQGNPKFSMETEIKNDEKVTAAEVMMMHGLLLEMYGVVAEIQGVDEKKTNTYISQYTPGVVYADIPDDSFETVKTFFSREYTFDDSDKYDTFSWVTKEQDVTDTSFKVVSTLTIKLDADFSKFLSSDTVGRNTIPTTTNNTIGTVNKTTVPTTTNNTTNQNKTNTVPQNTQAKNVVYDTSLPRTGEINDPVLITLYFIIAISVICLIVIVAKVKSRK